ncbi:MAG: PIN domain-containing protein, partial [Gammaproteobacteria bacterium]
MPSTPAQRLFVLDTNVLMHDPAALFRFKEHDVFLPMAVIEELDAAKKGTSEVSRNARQVSRCLDDLIGKADREAIERGLPLARLPRPDAGADAPGRVFLQTAELGRSVSPALPADRPANIILNVTLALMEAHRSDTVTLVSKDINLRIKARVLGVPA